MTHTRSRREDGPARSVVVSSRYRCRVHHDQPVTWKGTGCGQCTDTRGLAPRDEQHEGPPSTLFLSGNRGDFPATDSAA